MPEILAPAGSIPALYGALNAGADAVYVGADKFSARAYAENPSVEEICEALDYAHLFNKKIYLALNTLLKDSELKDALKILEPLYLCGLDGIIIQDIGLISVMKDFFPGLPLHASTQMAVASVSGARYLKDLGMSRIVLARELSMKEISDITKDGREYGYETECFVHGAMCYSYSGCCLFSSMAGGRSGNRGRCAGPCRKSYAVYDDMESAVKGRNGSDYYPLSMRDMCVIGHIGDMADAGVDSLKIEGRMKVPEYAAGVSHIYKTALTKYESGTLNKNDIKNYENDLRQLYIRSKVGTGYLYEYNGPDMLTLDNPSYSSIANDNESKLKADIKSEYIDKNYKLDVDMTVNVKTGEPVSLKVKTGDIVSEITGNICDKAQKNPTDDDAIKKQMMKTGNTVFAVKNLEIENDCDSFVPVGALNSLRRDGLDDLYNKLISKYHRESHVDIDGLYEKKSGALTTVKNQGVNLPEFRLSDRNQFKAFIDVRPEGTVSVDIFSVIFDDDSMVKSYINDGGKLKLILPHVIRQKNVFFINNRLDDLVSKYGDNVYAIEANGYDGLSFALKYKDRFSIFTAGSIYVFNRFAENFIKENGFISKTSYEKNKKELGRSGVCTRVISLYGYIPMMLSAGCVIKTHDKCDKKRNIIYLKDESGRIFPVKPCHELCHNVIYNNVPQVLFAKLRDFGDKYEYFSIDFTVEDYDETYRILNFIKDNYNESGIMSLGMLKLFEDNKFTLGHFNRGVM